MKTKIPSAFLILLSALLFASCGDNEKKSDSYYSYRVNRGYTGEAPLLPYHSSFEGKITGDNNPFSPDPLYNVRWDNISENDKLELYELYPVRVTTTTSEAFDNLESATAEKTSILVKGNGEFRVDFGVESAAWLEIDSPDLSGDIELSISEYTEPAVLNAGAQNPVKTKKPVKYGNTYRLELNDELHEGVRFGWIHIRNFDKPFTITKIRKVAQTKPVNYEGSFECDDAMLNRIWHTGAYGVRVNMLYDYISPILMERSDRYSWAGDAHLIQAASLVAFGNYPHIRQNLDHNRHKSQGIESYEMLWIKSTVDYYYHTGEKDLFLSYAEPLREKLDRGYEIFDRPDQDGPTQQGNYIGWDERLGAGFEWHQNPMNLRNYKFLWIETARMAAKAFKQAGLNELGNEYEDKARAKFEQLSKNPDFLKGLDIHAAAAAINTGLLTPEQEQKLYEERYTDRLHRVSFSPFNTYFIMESLSRMGKYKEIFETIDDCWGSEVRYGGTTFFEVFHPSWAEVLPQNAPIPNTQCGYTSLCHPWSSGVTRFITDEILGITPLTPGYTRALIKPNPVNLKWVKGNVPTPQGIIKADFNFDDGVATITVPSGVTATIGFPKRGLEVKEINRGNEKLWILGNKEDRTHVYVEEIGEGVHEFEIVTEGGFTPVKMSEPIKYHVEGTVEGNLSWENGHEKYGKDGLVVFQPDGNKEILPGYIESVKVAENNVNLGWKPTTIPSGSTVVYKDQQGKEVSAELGMLVTDNPFPCRQSFTVDIRKKGNEDYNLTIYVSDIQDLESRIEGFELFDLNTLELLSPLVVVSDYADGKFVTFKVDRDVRIRLYHIYGEQAMMSALLFSK